MLWFTGVDFYDPIKQVWTNLGLYTNTGAEKTPSAWSTSSVPPHQLYPGLGSGLICPRNANLNGQFRVLSYSYAQLILTNSSCY
jgi:hypothetical protein